MSQRVHTPAICQWSAAWGWRTLSCVYFEYKTSQNLENIINNKFKAYTPMPGAW